MQSINSQSSDISQDVSDFFLDSALVVTREVFGVLSVTIEEVMSGIGLFSFRELCRRQNSQY